MFHDFILFIDDHGHEHQIRPEHIIRLSQNPRSTVTDIHMSDGSCICVSMSMSRVIERMEQWTKKA